MCWRLRRPLIWAQQYDPKITEDGLFGTLPIYGYLRRYLVAILFAGMAILLMSTIVPILVIAIDECLSPPATFPPLVLSLLVALLFTHLGTIALYEIESAKRREYMSVTTKKLVISLRNRLWASALFLLFAIVVVGPATAFV